MDLHGTLPFYLLQFYSVKWNWRSWIKCWIVGFEVFPPVVVRTTFFWYMTPCKPLKVNGYFRGICRLHLQGRAIRPARYRRSCHMISRWSLARLIFRLWRWRRQFLWNVSWLSKDIHGVISQNILMFMCSVVYIYRLFNDAVSYSGYVASNVITMPNCDWVSM
jgi:hypothetical protein